MPKPRGPARDPAARPARAFVDSSAWVAFFSARDQNHRAADALFRKAVAQRVPLLTTNLIVAEVHRLVLHRAGPPAAAAVLARIESSPQVRLVFATALHHQAARDWLAKLSDQVITYTDAVSFAVMEAERCQTVASFDHDFVLAGFQVWRA